MRAFFLGVLPATAFVLSLSGCVLGPEHRPPELAGMPAAFKHEAGWRALGATPVATGGDWWASYGDDTLNALLADLERDNPGLAQAEARLRQAQAALRATRAGFAPEIGASASSTRSGSDAGAGNSHDFSLSVSWLPDLWGRVRREAEAGQAEQQASAADLAALRLSLQASLAQQYIRLRVLDRQHELLVGTEAAYARSLTLTTNQYDAGMAARADVVQAESQLESVRAQILELVDQRARAEHAVAVLAGQPPSVFAVTVEERLPALPAVPAGLPAELLARRPDLVVAERRVAAANARIGVAQSAWLPDLSLGLSGGYRSEAFRDWFEAPNRVWALGPSLAAVLFDGGARSAALERARATHDEAAAAWREAVLTALRETEDALARLRALETRVAQQGRVVELAAENERLVTNRYRAGLVSFLEVAVAQNATLTARRAELDIVRDRLEASVELVAALGGGWQAPAN
ncbi:efflux transporter outer membrane subunit [Pseudothauera nasutitermitis]|uniref:Efflux transporter outer membrane subunit n=1 Tax=Pseudothauera nasutitermitis TaxID=2565930 RepID=A0A4S4B0H3_9RHOO|nr:efflux transporter outer membrane subunit [Pseudothauera nasutitermitis]THF65980.1 efflux transporter outer membrane subunit [Pseudothauera nasutitermitis]